MRIDEAVEGLAGNGALYGACSFFKSIERLLLERGANPNLKNIRNETPLHLASRYGSVDIVQALHDHGAHLNVPCEPFGTALVAASSARDNSMVTFLIEKGLNISAIGGRYVDALVAAADGSHRSTVQLLLSHGAQLEKRAWQEHEDYCARLDEIYDSTHGKDQEEVVNILLKTDLKDDLHNDDLDWTIGD